MGFSDKRGDTLNVVNSPFSAVDDTGGELLFWQQQSLSIKQPAAGRWLLVLVVARFCGAKQYVRSRRAALKAKAAQEQAQVRQKTEEAEVRLSKDEQFQQRRANQRLGAGGDEPAYSRKCQTTIRAWWRWSFASG